MRMLTLGSSAFSTAQELVRPVIEHLPPEGAFDLIKAIEAALEARANPPEWLIAQDADKYCKWRWRMAFVGKDRPPYRPLGQQNFYRRSDVDAWAIARIESRPVVEHVR